RLLLVTGDLLLIITSIVGALLLWSTWAERIVNWALWREQALWALFIFTGWTLWLTFSNMYNLRLAITVAGSVSRIISGGVTIALAYLMLFFITSPAPIIGNPPSMFPPLTPGGLLPRLAPAIAIVGSTLLLLAWRVVYALALSGPLARRRVLILGAGKAGTIMHEVMREHDAHYQVLGFIDDDPEKQFTLVDGTPVVGCHERLPQLTRQYRVDEIIIAISSDVRGSMLQAIMDCYEQGIAIIPMPLLYEHLTGKIAVEHIGSQWYTALPLQQHAASNVLSIIKRLSDILFGLAGGIVFVVLCPLIAVAILLDSPGPIFYLQERAGLHGRSFQVRKFRSMIQNAEGNGQAQWAVKDDLRITRVGRFLRKTRLDELPQVINVLRGEMSLVGPRPERPQFIKQLQQQIPFYRIRLATKPGLTGWAQVNYGYGSTVEDALIKLQYDLYYIKHQAPWLDALIMLRTIGVVLRMKGQ
ncbi:MAG TPA: sugar transferase, partial [Herpetosiphonaceae bacterium]